MLKLKLIGTLLKIFSEMKKEKGMKSVLWTLTQCTFVSMSDHCCVVINLLIWQHEEQILQRYFTPSSYYMIVVMQFNKSTTNLSFFLI